MRKLTAKKIMMKFLENKNFLVYHLTGLELFDKRDFNEAKRWSEEKCIEFLERISCVADIKLCPWCVFHFKYPYHTTFCCEGCKYGKRHGNCLDAPDNVYTKIVCKLGKNFCMIPEFSQLMWETKDKYLSI